jgi:DNA polymerase III subunit epsilon
VTHDTIVFDTETTGLIVRNELNPERQPRMVEIAAVKLDPDLNEIARFSTLINPGCPLPPDAKNWYDITDEMLATAPSFPVALKEHILPFWLGARTVVAYNVAFDLEILHWELVRIGWTYRFPYCHDIVDAIQYRGGKRIKLDAWSKEVLGENWTPQTHRAMGDVERLVACYRTLK